MIHVMLEEDEFRLGEEEIIPDLPLHCVPGSARDDGLSDLL